MLQPRPLLDLALQVLQLLARSLQAQLDIDLNEPKVQKQAKPPLKLTVLCGTGMMEGRLTMPKARSPRASAIRFPPPAQAQTAPQPQLIIKEVV